MAQPERWQLSGHGPESYEQHMVPALFAPCAASLVAQAAPQPGERVLDAACGTGIVARLVAPQVGEVGRVIGLDLNPGMLAVARALPPPSGALLTWQEGSLEALPFEDEAFDVVLCQQGLQFCPNRAGAVREMRRVGLDVTARLRFFDHITTALQPYRDDEGYAIPIETHIARAHA